MIDLKNNFVLIGIGIFFIILISFIISTLYKSNSKEGFNTLPSNAIPFRFVRISKDIYSNIDYNSVDDLLEISRIALIDNNNKRYTNPAMRFFSNSSSSYGEVTSINIEDNQPASDKFFASSRGFVVLDFGKELNALDFSRLEITTGNHTDNNVKSRINGVTVMLLNKEGKPLNSGVPLIYNRTTNSPTVTLSMNPNSAQFFAIESACDPAKSGSCALQLSELRVITSNSLDSSNTVNSALNRPHIMSQALNGTFSSNNALDGNLTNMSHTQDNGGMFLVDLGHTISIADIDRVEIYNRYSGSEQNVMRQEGQKNSFVNLVKGSNVDNTYQSIPASDLTYLFYRQKPEINQIIVSSKNNSTSLNLSELAVYTDDNTRLVPGMSGVNVTYESLGGIFDNNYAVPNTYDGKINTKYHTAGGNQNPKLKITFPPRRDIKRIVFDNRDECCNDRVSDGGSIVISGSTGFSAEYKFGNTGSANADRFNYSFDLLNGRGRILVDLPVNNQKFLVKDPHKNKCIDDRGATSGGQQLYVVGCDPNNVNQQWTYDHRTGLIKNANKNLCWDDGGWSDANKNSGNPKATTRPCDPNNKNQQWRYSTRTRQFYNPNKTDQCLDDSNDGISMYLYDCIMNNTNQRFDIVNI